MRGSSTFVKLLRIGHAIAVWINGSAAAPRLPMTFFPAGALCAALVATLMSGECGLWAPSTMGIPAHLSGWGQNSIPSG